MKTTKLIERNAMHTIYLVMLKRIGKGYSAKELSFLIGANPDYVHAVESLQREGYTNQDITLIAKALEERNLNSFDFIDDLPGKTEIEMERIDRGGVIIHQCFVHKDEERTLSFLLNEVVSAHQVHASDAYVDMAKDSLQLLLDSGYFAEARSNYEIFKRINKFLVGGTLSPFYVEEALKEMSVDDETGCLKRVMEDETGSGILEC